MYVGFFHSFSTHNLSIIYLYRLKKKFYNFHGHEFNKSHDLNYNDVNA